LKRRSKKNNFKNGGKMIKAIIAGFDSSVATAIEEVGRGFGAEIITENVWTPSNRYTQVADYGTAYNFARLYALGAIKAAPHGTIFVGAQSMLRRINGGREHLIGAQVINRYGTPLCGIWTEPVSVPSDLVDEIGRRGITTTELETVLVDCYGSDPDPYCRLSGGRSRKQMIIAALLKVSDRRWLTSR
jgi:hypothetical protein